MAKQQITELKFGVKQQEGLTMALSFGPFKANERVMIGLRQGRVACVPMSDVDMQADELYVPVFFHDNPSIKPEWISASRLIKGYV